MILATHKAQVIYLVIDHEDNGRTYHFSSAESALKWKQELIEEFDTNAKNVSVLEREYDEFGNWLSQKRI